MKKKRLSNEIIAKRKKRAIVLFKQGKTSKEVRDITKKEFGIGVNGSAAATIKKEAEKAFTKSDDVILLGEGRQVSAQLRKIAARLSQRMVKEGIESVTMDQNGKVSVKFMPVESVFEV